MTEGNNHHTEMNIFDDINQNAKLEVKPYDAQMSGHLYKNGKKLFGMFSGKGGYILKPVINKRCEMEIVFYDEVTKAADAESKELLNFIPRYFGTTQIDNDGQHIRCLVLEDAVYGFRQPCIMDLKIGRQTWDPLATEEKRRNEEAKYYRSKRDLGFCITGFQYYDLINGERKQYGKELGKSLDGATVRDALGSFLNGRIGFHRTFLLQILAKLWQISRWFRTQTRRHFYSSSILLVYDAAVLKEHMAMIKRKVNNIHKSTLGRQLSLRESKGPLTPGFEPKPSSPAKSSASAPSSPLENWDVMFDNVCKTHSLENNYEKDLKSMKENYSVVLKDLLQRDAVKSEWVRVKMIDFPHVFPANSIDRNYKEGLDNLVGIFEEFLSESSL